MKAIETAYINALLADACYISVATNTSDDELRERLTPAQFDFLLANFKVEDSIETPGALGSGFYAVVSRSEANSKLARQDSLACTVIPSQQIALTSKYQRSVA
ncbi:MAG: hypothetical protein V4695_05860 [Pseudomonadota bacterium]